MTGEDKTQMAIKVVATVAVGMFATGAAMLVWSAPNSELPVGAKLLISGIGVGFTGIIGIRMWTEL